MMFGNIVECIDIDSSEFPNTMEWFCNEIWLIRDLTRFQEFPTFSWIIWTQEYYKYLGNTTVKFWLTKWKAAWWSRVFIPEPIASLEISECSSDDTWEGWTDQTITYGDFRYSCWPQVQVLRETGGNKMEWKSVLYLHWALGIQE